MPEERSSTPERELLKFIEDKETGPGIKAKLSVRQGRSFFSLGGLRGRFSYAKFAFKNFSVKGFVFDIKKINFFLMLLVTFLAVGMLYDFIRSLVGLNDAVEAAFTIDETQKEYAFHEIPPLENSSFYLEKARKRDIFKFVTAAEIEQTTPAAQQERPRAILAKTQDLRLVGISWSKDPDAMIEDQKASKTFFVKRGDVVNDVKVEAIFKDKIVLSYDGDEVELK